MVYHGVAVSRSQYETGQSLLLAGGRPEQIAEFVVVRASKLCPSRQPFVKAAVYQRPADPNQCIIIAFIAHK
jgi:hypothetical protein